MAPARRGGGAKLGRGPDQLAALRERNRALAALVLAPFAPLAPLAWAVSRLFAEPTREGLVALGSPAPRSPPSHW